MFRFVIVAVCCVCLSVTPASADDDTAQAGARYKQAFTRFEDALQAVRETGDTRAQAKMLEQVIEDLDGASKIYQDAGKTGEAAACRLLAARSTRLQGKTGRAPKLFAEAERLARQSDARPLLVQVLIGQSFCELVEVKNLELADAKAGEALRVASTVDDAKLLFEAMCLMSEVDVAQSELASAWDWIERAFTLAPKVKDKDDVLFYGHVDRSQVCYQLATRADTQPVFDFAEQMAQQAAESADAANAIATRRGWKFLGQQSQRLAKTARQRRELIQMQRGFHKLLGDVQTIRAFNPQGPGEVLVTRKFVSEAGVVPPWFLETVKQLQSIVVDDATRAYLEASVAGVAGKTTEARAGYLRAVELLEGEYRNLANYEARKAMITPVIGYHYYYWPMLYLLDQDDTAQAFSLMEASRARLLMDLLAAGQQIELSDPRKQKLHSELRGLRAQISDLRQRYDRTLRLKDATPSGEREFAEIGRLDARQRELLEQIRNEAPELLEITTAGTVALDEIQQLATREKFDLLEYVVFGDQIVAWHIGPSGVHVRGIFLPRAQLLEKIEALNRTLVDPHVRFDARLARQFYLFLIEPLEEFVSTQQLVVVPHDELYFLSFQVLQDPSDGHYLTDKYQISYAPSARVLKQMGRVASLEGASALAVAAPSVLKSQAEAEAVARLLPRSKVVLPNSATKVLVKRFCAGYEVLHLSAHGEFNRNDPLLSFVQLAPQPDDDGKLTAGGMAALPLMNTRLVTLSACETGRVSETVAGEMLGMPRSLIFAGAKSVLLTRWKVDPEGTNRWMARFYTDASRASLPNAARKASADLKSDPQFAHPYFWGPFVLVGR